MKNIYLLLSAALVLGACQSDALDEASVQPNTPTTTITPTPQVSFAQPDGAVKLSNNTAQAVWQLLQKVSPEQALQLGETEITDAQYAEIKNLWTLISRTNTNTRRTSTFSNGLSKT